MPPKASPQKRKAAVQLQYEEAERGGGQARCAEHVVRRDTQRAHPPPPPPLRRELPDGLLPARQREAWVPGEVRGSRGGRRPNCQAGGDGVGSGGAPAQPSPPAAA